MLWRLLDKLLLSSSSPCMYWQWGKSISTMPHCSWSVWWSFSTRGHTATYLQGYHKTKALLNGYSREDFLNLPRADKNSTEYWQIKMWKMAMILSFHLNTQFAPLIGCRIIQLSSESGWSPDSAFGLYAFAHALICVLEDVEEGHFWYV